MIDFLWTIAGIIKWLLVLVVIGIILLSYFQNKILYMPVIPNLPKSPKQNPPNYRDPSNFKMQFEDITIDSTDNLKIRGWLIFSDQPSNRTIIYFHQNAGNIGTRLPAIKSLSRFTNSNVLIVAYRGYSNSDGVPTQKGLREDGLAIVEFASRHPKIDASNIYILGRSLGGAVGSHVATHPTTKKYIKGIILQVTFSSIDDMVDVLFKPLKYLKPLILKNHWRTIDLIKNIQCPIFFIKASNDQLVPCSQMDRLISQAKKHQKQIKQITVIGADHNCVAEINPKQYFENLNQFLNGNY